MNRSFRGLASSIINMIRNLGCMKYIFVLLFLSILVASAPQNPCPELFQYQYEGTETIGVIQLRNIAVGQTVVLRVKLSLAALLTTNYFGVLELFEDRQKTLQGLLVHRPVLYRIRFPTQNPLPRLTEISVNNQVICSGPPENGLQVTKIQLDNTLYTTYFNKLGAQPSGPFIPNQNSITFTSDGFNGPNPIDQHPLNNNNFQAEQFGNIGFGNSIPTSETFTPTFDTFNPSNYGDAQNTNFGSSNVGQNNPNLGTPNNPFGFQQNSNLGSSNPNIHQPSFIPSTSNPPQNNLENEMCGQIDSKYNIKRLVVGGERIHRGSWPWLVAIFLSDHGRPGFKCGGSLLSSTLTITAAHCFINQGRRYLPENVLVTLGAFNINNWNEPGSVVLGSSGIFIHADYEENSSSFDADIALVKLQSSVRFTDTIRPICLWTGPSSIKDIEGSSGTVVGWGKDENGNEFTAEPKKVQASVFADTTCVRSNRLFRPIMSKRNFCAGDRNGEGPCTGDSGSGLMIYQSNRWELRGIVAGSLSDTTTSSCDLKQFIVYVDISNFIDWIQQYM